MNNTYDVVFKGELAEGQNVENVKAGIAALFKTEAKKVEKIFSGDEHVIKKDVDFEQGQKIRSAFLKAGAICYLNNRAAEATKANEPQSKSTSPAVQEIKDEISNKVAEAAAQMKPLVDEAKKKASQAINVAAETIKSDMAAGGIQGLFKNKYFLSSAVACLVILVLFFGVFSGGGNAMPLTMQNMEKIANIMENAQYQISENQMKKFETDRTAAFEYIVMRPIENMGYDFEATISGTSAAFVTGDLPMEQSMMAIVILGWPSSDRDILYDEGIISKDTKELLDKVAVKLKQK